MADTLESLEIEVKYNASGAGKEIDKITSAINSMAKALSNALPQLKEYASLLSKVGGSIRKSTGGGGKSGNPISEDLKESIKEADRFQIAIHKVSDAQVRMAEAFENGNENAAWRAREQELNARAQASKYNPDNALPISSQEVIKTASAVDVLKAKLVSLKAAMQEAFEKGDTTKAFAIRGQIIQTEKAIDRENQASIRLKHGLQGVAKEAAKARSPMENLMKSIGRIAFYRMIRSAIKAVTQAFSEGIKAAYIFSSSMAGEGHRFAQAMDNVNIAANTVKGQLGSAFISLYAAIAPIIIAILNLITKLADALSQLFSAFTGTTYLKAEDTASNLAASMAGGAKAAEEWKNQLMGFDEINKLEAPGNGGGGGGTNPTAGFSMKDTPLDDWAMKIHNSLAAIELAAAGFALALGLILTLSGANIPLGLALIAVGVAGMVHALKEDWSTVDQSVARVLSAIMLTLGGAMLAVGALLAFSGANVPLGIGLMAAGAVSIATGVMIDWKALPHNVKTVLSDIMLAAGGAMLALGLVITFATPAFSPLGLGLIVAGAASLAAAAAINWDWLTEMMQGRLGTITAIAGGALLAIGLILALTGVALPLGLGLMVAGGAALGTAIAVNWDSITQKIQEVLNNIKQKWESLKSTITASIQQFVSSVTSIFTGLASKIQSVVQSIINFVQNMISKIQRAVSSVGSFLSGIGGSVRGFAGSIGIKGFASGGFPEDGLFFANHGEMVGQFSNGKTAVANNAEIVEGIKQGVIEAMMMVGGANSGGGKQTEFVFNLNGREFARAIYNDQKAVSRERGVSYLTGS